MIHQSILDTIGHTPLIRLRKVTPGAGTEILVKAEGFNPAGSIKDRTALSMIEQAEVAGILKPTSTIIESTSGNLGKALALIGAVKGYSVILVIDPNTPRSVINFVNALGARLEMVSTPDEQGGYQRPRIARVKQLLAATPGSFWPDQYNNPNNPKIHATKTANEIIEDARRFSCLIASVSTGGHISGLSATLKKHIPNLTTIAVDAAGSATFGHPYRPYAMHGLGLAWKPGNLDQSVIDELQLVDDIEGIATSRVLARHEGLLVGESGGAAVFAALHYAHRHPGQRIIVIAPDSSVNYLDEQLNNEWLWHGKFGDFDLRDGCPDPDELVTHARKPRYAAISLGESIRRLH